MNETAAQAALEGFAAGPWGAAKYPTIVQSRRRAWAQVVPFYAFPPEVRRIIYTTNAIKSLHMRLRKIIKTRGHFPSGYFRGQLRGPSTLALLISRASKANLAQEPDSDARLARPYVSAY